MKLNNSTFPKTAVIAAALFGAVLGLVLSLSGPVFAHPPTKAPHEATETAQHEGGMKGMKGMKMGDHDHGDETFSFGHPSPDARPDRAVDILALDTMRFDPPVITVKPGSVIEFVVTNKGEIPHSWSIDSETEQVEHEQGMEGMPMEKMMGHMDGEPNGFVLKPGETKTLTWTFTKGGDIEYACHLPGHYGAGMHGQVMIEGAQKAAPDGHDEAKGHVHEDH